MRSLVILLSSLLLLALLLTGLAFWLAEDLPFGAGGSGHTVLTWRLNGELSEHDTSLTLPFPGQTPALTLGSVVQKLRAARADPAIGGLALYIQDAAFGLARAAEVRRQLSTLRASGKRVDCYLETAGEGGNGTLEYYLATACERILLAPAGDLNLLGLHLDAPFFRGTLDKLEIYPDWNHVGAYKSAGETFTAREHSPAAEEALGALLDSAWETLIGELAAARGKPAAEILAHFDAAPHSAKEALALGLVDQLAYPDEFRASVEQAAGDRARLLPLDEYRPTISHLGRPTVAVLFAVGTILRGSGGTAGLTGEVYLGSDDMARELRRLAEDDGVAAVVLRVDSPGGSALASDLILREVSQLAERKPLVVSMSDVAASGGYYIAARAHRILAEASTITGSIGVVSGKFVTRDFENNLLGISHDPLSRGKNATIYSSLAPYTPDQQARLGALMAGVYETFLGHVAAGRSLEPSAVEAVAAGRVWTGRDALAHRLVDELGGLDRAVELACEAAGEGDCADADLVLLPEPPDLLSALAGADSPALGLLRLRATLAALRAPQELLPGPEPRLELPPGWRALAEPF